MQNLLPSLSWAEEKWIPGSRTPSTTETSAASIKSHKLNHENTFTFYLFKASISLSGWVGGFSRCFPDRAEKYLQDTNLSTHPLRNSCPCWLRALSKTPSRARLSPDLSPLSRVSAHSLTQAGTGQMEMSWLLAASPKVYPYTEG